MTISWSNKAKKAIPLFFKEWNDIDIYIEDKEASTQKIYIEIIQRLTDGKYKVARIFPLGNRQKVLEASAKAAIHQSKRPELYIIDGDLDLILGETPAKINNLYMHNCYCIENVLFDEGAAIEIMYEEDATKSKEDLAKQLEFNSKLRMEVEYLIELFVVFGLMRKYFPKRKSVSLGLSEFTSGGKNPYLSDKLINTYIARIQIELCKDFGSKAIIEDKIKMYEHIGDDDSATCYVSGKDFLLPLLARHMRNIVNIKATRESLKIRMAKCCKIGWLTRLKESIYQAFDLA
ncbi:MAG: hypothetical protein SRB2_03333 [Desulfobacteraceae bacterium Eth-SRB2]|nr:MAG: hypothetical protein SRB2_03333 [Desulfobacteraceae bacterium Eth-SRB2]